MLLDGTIAANDSEKLEAFRDFWDSGDPLIGDEGGLGWLQTISAPSAGEELSTFSSAASVHKHWHLDMKGLVSSPHKCGVQVAGFIAMQARRPQLQPGTAGRGQGSPRWRLQPAGIFRRGGRT